MCAFCFQHHHTTITILVPYQASQNNFQFLALSAFFLHQTDEKTKIGKRIWQQT